MLLGALLLSPSCGAREAAPVPMQIEDEDPPQIPKPAPSAQAPSEGASREGPSQAPALASKRSSPAYKGIKKSPHRMVPVTFRAHELGAAELHLRHVGGGWRTLSLAPEHERHLTPGTYILELRLDDQWSPAGRLTVDESARSYEVRMLGAPPWREIEEFPPNRP